MRFLERLFCSKNDVVRKMYESFRKVKEVHYSESILTVNRWKDL